MLSVARWLFHSSPRDIRKQKVAPLKEKTALLKEENQRIDGTSKS